MWLRDRGVMIEQKGKDSSGNFIDLDKPEKRSMGLVTPFEQVLHYAQAFMHKEQPRFLITCNFERFRVYDRDQHSDALLGEHAFEFTLEEFGDHPEYLGFIADPANTRLAKETEISVQAGRLVAELYDRLYANYIDPEDEKSLHDLNILCVRLVFCMYCEDAGIFQKDAFLNYLCGVNPQHMRAALRDLFRVLDTPVEDRDPYETSINLFPYVNGGLFRGDIEIPNFDEDTKRFLLDQASGDLDWSRISPTVFGGIFESTLNAKIRREGGMHYTSPENIHKVIDPLFLDDLKAELRSITSDASIIPRNRTLMLHQFLEKLTNLTFFDPACGSGNFLTETYLCLRRLEDEALAALNNRQTALAFDVSGADRRRVSLDQFYGIEINDFAVSVAQTALWISRLRANYDTMMTLNMPTDDLPLKESAHIIEGNALRLDWNDVLPASKCTYILGNPPFFGARMQSAEQKAEIQAVYHGAKNSGNIDYVAGWYMKAAEYIGMYGVRCAFVSTNSICQGEQVANVWQPIFDRGVHIDFAYDSFRWKNEASDQAHVFVVIVGFSTTPNIRKLLFIHSNPDSESVMHEVENINAYLMNAPDTFIWNRSKPLCDVPEMGIGNKPIDGGNYLFTSEELTTFLAEEPGAERYIHPWLGSKEFINGTKRYVLWLGEASDEELVALPHCRARIEAVRELRAKSKSAPTRKIADTPTRFHVENMPESTSILIPETSSERRDYIPMGFIDPTTFCSNAVKLIPNSSIYHFGVLTSQIHNAWMRAVAGRLKSDYRYSAGVVYNNFVWPEPSAQQRTRIEETAQGILDARAAHEGKSLAELYDPDKMPADLLAAHKANDRAVEDAYGVSFNGDEAAIVAHLFTLYAHATENV